MRKMSVLPDIEMLENRRMLAATMSRTVLNIDGTTAADVIVLSETKGKNGNYNVTIGGSTVTFPKRQVTKIIIRGNAGNDTITVKKLGSYTRVLAIYGDDGNDTITGTAGRDAIFGGAGDDFIRALGGNDTIRGGAGNDAIRGGAGNDRISGEDGKDTLYGDAGNDTISGGAGDDILAGDDEDYLAFAGKPATAYRGGRDILNGGDGNDWLLGGTSNAKISGNAGRDTLTGGAGADVIDARGNSVIRDKNLAEGDFVPAEDYAPASAQPDGVHAQIKLTIQVKNKQGQYDTAVIPAFIGYFSESAPAAIQTKAGDSIVYFDAPAGSSWKVRDVLRVWGITFDSGHIGRYRAATNRPLTMTIDGTNNTSFADAVLPVSGAVPTEVVIKLG